MTSTQTKAFLILGYGVTGKALADHMDRTKQFYHIWEDQQVVTRTSPHFLGQIRESDLTSDFAQKTAMVLPSPGAPLTHPTIQWGMQQNLPVLSEVEWASRFLEGNFIGVTGTNGKSTTVKLIHELLKAIDVRSGIFGNYGLPLICACEEPLPFTYVVEESSYQLEHIEKLHHQIAVCLNITPDHLDRYGNMEDYRKAKARIVENSSPEDVFIYNADNLGCVQIAKESQAQNLPFSLANEFEEGGFTKDGQMIIRLSGKEFCFDLADCALPGWHNQENMLAALLTVLNINSEDKAVEAYKQVLKTFKGLPHRVEFVCEENGARYYDDSKATNVEAVAMALTSFDNPIVLIMGGKDKDGNFNLLKGLVQEKVKTLILCGDARDKIASVLAENANTKTVATLKEATALAKQTAESGDVVLLSPGCASFDEFKNFVERGLCFQSWVKNNDESVSQRQAQG